MKKNKKNLHFRVDTPQLLKEISNHAIREGTGVLFVPLNVFRGFLTQVAERCAAVNDPILNRLMFDMNLYELPGPTTKEYREIMNQVYNDEKKYLSNLKPNKNED